MWYHFVLNKEKIYPTIYPHLSLSNVVFKDFVCPDDSNLLITLIKPIDANIAPVPWKGTSQTTLVIVLRFIDELYWICKGRSETNFRCNAKIASVNGIVRGTIRVDNFELEIQSNFLLIDSISFVSNE